MVYGVGVYNLIVIAYLTALAMVLGLGCLLAWHTRLISRGETSIEHHINKNTVAKFRQSGKVKLHFLFFNNLYSTKTCFQVYKNPYDFGIRENWRIFTGLNCAGRSFLTHLLLPSSHKPDGDGLTFLTAPIKQSELHSCSDAGYLA